MKSCPACNRKYEDDTLSFCLEDGTRLTAVASSADPSQRNAYPPQTEILPSGDALPGSPTLRMDAGASPLTHPQQRTTNQASVKSGGGPWIVVGGLLAGVVVLLIGVGGYLAWNSSRASSPEQPPVQSSIAATSPTPTNTKVKTQPSATPTPSPTPNWIEGVWEGKGYQTDTNTTWSVRLIIRDNNFAISYPDIPCSGVWAIVDQTTTGGTFREIISKNVSNCANNSQILLQKVTDNELSLKYSHENTRAVVATATLRKKATKKE